MPTEGILVSGEEAGRSRHNLGFRLKARHPVIASIIYEYGASSDQQKFEILNGLLSNLDPGFPEDLRLLQEITKRREIASSFAQFDMRRALSVTELRQFCLVTVTSFQHRSILEREMRDSEEAIRFARMAVRSQPENAGFQNTLGMALDFAARRDRHRPAKETNSTGGGRKALQRQHPARPDRRIQLSGPSKHRAT